MGVMAMSKEQDEQATPTHPDHMLSHCTVERELAGLLDRYALDIVSTR